MCDVMHMKHNWWSHVQRFQKQIQLLTGNYQHICIQKVSAEKSTGCCDVSL